MNEWTRRSLDCCLSIPIAAPATSEKRLSYHFVFWFFVIYLFFTLYLYLQTIEFKPSLNPFALPSATSYHSLSIRVIFLYESFPSTGNRKEHLIRGLVDGQTMIIPGGQQVTKRGWNRGTKNILCIERGESWIIVIASVSSLSLEAAAYSSASSSSSCSAPAASTQGGHTGLPSTA